MTTGKQHAKLSQNCEQTESCEHVCLGVCQFRASGPKSEKNRRRIDFGLTRKTGKKSPKNRKNGSGPKSAFSQSRILANRVTISDFSSRPWRNLLPTWVIHMATRRPAHNTPRSTWTGGLFKKTIQEIHVDRRVVGWSAGCHVDHPCGWQISP